MGRQVNANCGRSSVSDLSVVSEEVAIIAPIIYGNGKIQDIEAAKKKILVPKPKPGLFTSSTNRWGALILGIFLFYVGAGTAYHLIVDPGKEWPLIYIIVFIIGLSCLPVHLDLLPPKACDFVPRSTLTKCGRQLPQN